jgi:hypothetical protein
MFRLLAPVAFAALLIGSLACTANPRQAYDVVTPAALTPGTTVPAPASEPILTLTGAIASTNTNGSLVFDMRTLEQVGLVTYAIDDPWREARTTYTGVLVSDLLKVAKVPASATSLHFTALDDYEVDLPIADVNKYPILLATRANGDYMPLDDGGPSRIIFPYDAYRELNPLETKDLLIWSVMTLEVQ